MTHGLPSTLVDAIRARLGVRARPDESLARHTSFRIGGPADLLVVPDTVDELAHVLRTAAAAGVRVALLGGGSNMLIGDGGVRGIIVKLGRGFSQIQWLEEEEQEEARRESAGPPRVTIRAGAAVHLGRLARAAVSRGLAGLEYAEGIPGTVGGALFMNAGAYGGEVAHVVEAVEGLDPVTGERREIEGSALAFRYRRTELPHGFVVTAARFRLRREGRECAAERMDEVRRHRVASQPQGRANAGSIFKNPPGDHAGRLIDAAGLKGTRAGRARISERHGNFIVNEGGARAVDVKALMDLAQRVVWERSGVWLEPEVQLVGSW
jgi:UDP-N-acetylmuramate dehydrogenase